MASVAPVAHAQSPSDKAAAEVLFQAGRELMTSGKYAEACAKLEASQKLDAGLGTLLYLADCYEKANRLASAWATFREAESIASGRADTERATIARQHYTALEPRLSKLWIHVADGNDPATLVKRDGEPIPRESWGIAIPIDAGDHLLEASAPGRTAWSGSVHVEGEGKDVPVEVPQLGEAPVTEPASTPPVASTPAAPAAATAPVPSSSMSTQRVVGIVVGSVGIVGIGVGSFFGLRAKAKKDDSLDNGHCPNNPNVCDQTGTDLRNQARSSATVATVSMIAGGAALAGGIVLFLTAPRAHAEGASVSSLRVTAQSDGFSSARVSLGGNF